MLFDKMLDVTPHDPTVDRILFLPDPGRAYDFATERRLQNHRRTLGELPMVPDYIAASAELSEYLEANSTGRTINVSEQKYRALLMKKAQLQAQICVTLATQTKRNDPCFCASGRKFKHCCRPLIDLHDSR